VSSGTPAPAGNENALSEKAKFSLALCQLVEALRLLDEGNAPPEIGARLDEVIQRVRTLIELRHQGDL
jgi:hypothetical protein